MRRVFRVIPASAIVAVTLTLSTLQGCATFRSSSSPVPRAPSVDLSKYAGPWFIIGAIGLTVEKGGHNPVETYTPNPDGSIATVFQLRRDAFDGELKTYPTVAKVDPGTNNAVWHVTTIWPLKQQYVIAYLEPDYSAAIVARDSRDLVWILSRTPRLSEARQADYRKRIAQMGYNLSKFELYPQNGNGPSAGPR